MPFVQVTAIKDVFTPEQKREVIQRVTDAMVAVEGEELRGVTWVTFQEVESGCWGIGGQPLTTGAVHAMQEAS
ncbi:MAG: tautomerase family protein [Ottowia sp.]|nr:tautomerase family protein [Halieaceae bacterium]MCB2068483.1 tautomerase family protein [Ottowia sp.]MCP5148735.1 tautomerase family protein [Pseudomonadales bacterium]